jgi:hypothetical protein
MPFLPVKPLEAISWGEWYVFPYRRPLACAVGKYGAFLFFNRRE